MREFTAKEIELCKKIAEKDFKEITYGDYYSHGDGAWYLCDGHKLKHALDTIDVIPIWQEHDCLIWLRKRQWKIEYWHENFSRDWIEIGIVCCFPDPDLQDKKIFRKGKTVLEILQSFILAILDEK